MVKDKKNLLFSLTKDDFVWTYFRGSGAGGQHRNKTSSAVRVVHPPSGARGECQEERSQLQNRRRALQRLVDTTLFQSWVAAKTRGLKTEKEIEAEVAESIANPANIKLEVKDGKGWKEIKEEELT